MNNIVIGNFYFISDEFFRKINDPFLKRNYDITKRPHYFAVKDKETQLYWFVPCSSQTDKFERVIRKKQERRKPANTIKIIKLQDRKMVLLFQDMFPVNSMYIQSQYIRGGQPVSVKDSTTLADLQKTANRTISLIRRGIKFTPTQPDALRIEKLMLDELSKPNKEIQIHKPKVKKPRPTLGR